MNVITPTAATWHQLNDHFTSIDVFLHILDSEATRTESEVRVWTGNRITDQALVTSYKKRLARLESLGVTDYLKPPWTEGLQARKRELQYKLDEMSAFADEYDVGVS